MYKKETSMSLMRTPSMLPNNLAISKTKYLSYSIVHKSVACINTVVGGAGTPVQKLFPCKGDGTSGNTTLMQVKWCNVSGREIMVFASVKGIQMFEQDGLVMVFWHAISQPQELKSFSCYARGICSVLNRFICVGTSSGSILVFDVPAQGTAIKLYQTLDYHKVGITDVTSGIDKTVSADEDGNIIVWQCDESMQKCAEVRGSGVPCTSLALWKSFIIGAYSSGHIRIFDLATGILKVEICAHSRCINALDIAKESGQLMSVSEDTFVRVWAIPKDFSNKIELIFQTHVSDSQLCGGRFLNESGQSFAVTGYDLGEIIIFSKK